MRAADQKCPIPCQARAADERQSARVGAEEGEAVSHDPKYNTLCERASPPQPREEACMIDCVFKDALAPLKCTCIYNV